MKRSSLKQIILTSMLIFSSQLYAAHTITLHNATSCLVNNWQGTKTIVPAVDVYSFFYKSSFPESLTYYSTIPANETGVAIVSEHNPNTSPYIPLFTLGYSPSPDDNSQGGASFVSTTIDDFNNWYIYQSRYADNLSNGLQIASRNPCAE